MRGVRLRTPNEYDKHIWRILKNIDVGKYYWHISQDEILFFDKTIGRASSDFFQEDEMAGEEFIKYINCDVDYYVHSINARAYLSDVPEQKIKTYADFLESDCQMVFLGLDSTYVDIYLKDADLAKTILDTCISEGFNNVEYITDENEERTALNLGG